MDLKRSRFVIACLAAGSGMMWLLAPLLMGAAMADDASSMGGTVTFIESAGIGRIAVCIQEPESPRYAEGAPIIVNVSGFFTASSGFAFEWDADAVGVIYITYLWPGQRDNRTGYASEGVFDYGGPDCLAALRDVIRFATGEMTDVSGRVLQDIVSVPPAHDVCGVYAFSHSGIAATNVLALHGEELSRVAFFVGRENPTTDALYPLETGHWGDDGRAVVNPFYDPSGYTPTSVDIDYTTVYWCEEVGRPAFRVAHGMDYVCSAKHPKMWGKDYWSTALLQALLNNGALTRETWPKSLATPDEAVEQWSFRTTVHNYARLAAVLPDLKVMLVFAADDHVQTAIDKPHIHQAYDGFRKTAGLWVRLNPDRAYVETFLGSAAALPDNPANAEPSDWQTIRAWGYRTPPLSLNKQVPLAAVAEMCDRTFFNAWMDDVAEPLWGSRIADETEGG